MDDAFFLKLEKFRDKANSSAHSVDAQITPKFFSDNKVDINYAFTLLQSIKQKASGAQ